MNSLYILEYKDGSKIPVVIDADINESKDLMSNKLIPETDLIENEIIFLREVTEEEIKDISLEDEEFGLEELDIFMIPYVKHSWKEENSYELS